MPHFQFLHLFEMYVNVCVLTDGNYIENDLIMCCNDYAVATTAATATIIVTIAITSLHSLLLTHSNGSPMTGNIPQMRIFNSKCSDCLAGQKEISLWKLIHIIKLCRVFLDHILIRMKKKKYIRRRERERIITLNVTRSL